MNFSKPIKKIYFLSTGILLSIILLLYFSLSNFLKFSNTSLETSSHSIESGKSFIFNQFKIYSKDSNLFYLMFSISLVIFLSRLLSILLKKINQPGIIGELLTGIILGPSILGHFFPNVYHTIFQIDNLKNIELLSQFSTLFFMFLVGSGINLEKLKENSYAGYLISHSSILIIFFFSLLFSIYLYPKYSDSNYSLFHFSFYLSLSIGITAFPTLYKIIQHKGLLNSKLGIASTTVSAIDNLTIWFLFSCFMIVLQSPSNIGLSMKSILFLSLLFFLILKIKPLIHRMSLIYNTEEIISRTIISSILLLLFTVSIFIQILGIPPIVGALLVGILMPSDSKLRFTIDDKIEEFSFIVLLPLYFVISGFKIQINIFSNLSYILDLFLILFVFSLIKIITVSFISKKIGFSNKESGILGILLNTKGLMEIILLNIGLENNLYSVEFYTILIISSILSTFLTAPILTYFFNQKETIKQEHIPKKSNNQKILIAFGPPTSGISLFLISYSLFKQNGTYTAMHLSPHSEKLSLETKDHHQNEMFQNILEISEKLSCPIETVYNHTNNIAPEIIKKTNEESYDFLILGPAKTIFGNNILGGKVETILSEVNSKVGIFMDRGFTKITSLLILYHNPIEAEVLFEIGGMIQKDGITDINLVYEKGNEPSEDRLRKHFLKGIRATSTDKNSKKIISRFSLILIGYSHYIEIIKNQNDKTQTEKYDWHKDTSSSILILKSKDEIF